MKIVAIETIHLSKGIQVHAGPIQWLWVRIHTDEGLIGLGETYPHPEAEKAGYDKMTSILDIHLKDGRTVSGRADFGKGSPANPMSHDEVAEKFRGCAGQAGWPAAKVEGIIDTVHRLESLKDIHGLMRLCARV